MFTGACGEHVTAFCFSLTPACRIWQGSSGLGREWDARSTAGEVAWTMWQQQLERRLERWLELRLGLERQLERQLGFHQQHIRGV